MEDLLLFALQFLCELVLQILAFGPWDALFYTTEGRLNQFGRVFLSLLLGGAAGLFSIFWFPHVFIHHVGFRIANLVLSPAITGYLSYEVASWLEKRWATVSPENHALFAFLFSLAFGVVRFAYAHRF